jgi:hypothetical protein
MTFGIPDFVIPIEATGEVNLNHHFYFLKRERAKEEELRVLPSSQQTVALGTTNSLDRIVVPGTLDILNGRGRSVPFHSGNVVRILVRFLFCFWQRAAVLLEIWEMATYVCSTNDRYGQ